MDLRGISAIPSVFTGIVEDFGQLDILIYNAGMGKHIPALDVSESGWDEMMSFNLKASFFCAQAAKKTCYRETMAVS
jgi:NAD(P)-dependent dehydrogenase (short-subunit alcohol dehydrogenase family)